MQDMWLWPGKVSKVNWKLFEDYNKNDYSHVEHITNSLKAIYLSLGAESYAEKNFLTEIILPLNQSGIVNATQQLLQYGWMLSFVQKAAYDLLRLWYSNLH